MVNSMLRTHGCWFRLLEAASREVVSASGGRGGDDRSWGCDEESYERVVARKVACVDEYWFGGGGVQCDSASGITPHPARA